MNRFGYVENRPVNFNDPTGHYACGDGFEDDCDPNPKGLSPVILPPGIDSTRDKRLRDLLTEAESLSAMMQEGEITDLDALALLLDYAAGIYGEDTEGALTDLGIVVGGLDTTGNVPRIIDGDNPLSVYYIGYAAFDPELTGFNSNLNMNNENQVRHFLAGVAGSTASGALGELGMLGDETRDILGILGGSGGSMEDVRVYNAAYRFSHYLNGNPALPGSSHPLSDASSWVYDNLAP